MDLKRVLRYPREWQGQRRTRALSRRAHHYLAVCAMFQNEARFLREWLIFHQGVGVEHFYLYDNSSTDGFREVLAEFGGWTLVDWPYRESRQERAYRHCARRYGDRCRWIAFIDLDEFLFSPLERDVRRILTQYEDAPGVLVGSVFYGASGHSRVPPGPLLEAFTMRRIGGLSGKSVANPHLIRAFRNAHVPAYYGSGGASAPLEQLRINHYWARSLEDLAHKCGRGDGWSGQPRVWNRVLEEETTMNEVRDTSIIELGRAIRSGYAARRSTPPSAT